MSKEPQARKPQAGEPQSGEPQSGEPQSGEPQSGEPQSGEPHSSCQVIRPGDSYQGKQGFAYFAGISAQSAGSKGLCMHLLTIAPGDRARAHLHENHETAIYVLSGVSEMWYGHRLEHHVTVGAGEMLYIPPGMPHLPANTSDEPVTAVIARTDPNEQESVVLLPELDSLVPFRGPQP